jgi:FAD/FMN-containing dehydrogenase
MLEHRPAQFTNWSGQYPSNASVLVAPETVEELERIVRDRGAYPSPVVAIGNGHSNSGCNVVTGGTAVSMKRFDLLGQPTMTDVTVGAGMQLLDVHRHLAARRMQLPFTPEIGNATLGSVACCCLKDAAIGKSSGIATGMIKTVRFVDAAGQRRELTRGDAGWEAMTSSHGLFGIIYEVVLDVIPMALVIQNYVTSNVADASWERTYRQTLSSNDGIFGLLNATTGQFIFETRNVSPAPGAPNTIENLYNRVDQRVFKYFNPIMGTLEANWYSALVRRAAMAGFRFMGRSFPAGRRTFKNLKPIDYSHRYRWRWDFHFWAYPVEQFPTVVLPAFLRFLREYKAQHPAFDEKGLMACYRLRVEPSALLSPTYSEDRMTLDPLRPLTADARAMQAWDDFCYAYNEFAVAHGGKCTFNQTKVLTKAQVEGAFGDLWDRFKAARESADPDRRFLSAYFQRLIFGGDVHLSQGDLPLARAIAAPIGGAAS